MCNKARNALSQAASEVVNDLSKYNSVFALNDSENSTCAREKEAVQKRTWC